jgi:predicted anti-sigma-YlaC factor YlaD
MTELATDYMEGRASMSTGAMIKLHLMMCEHCANYYAQLEQVRVAAGNADADPTSANIDALTSRFKEWHDRQPKD